MASDPVEGEQSSKSTAGKEVKDWMKVVLELALVLLKVSREVVGLIKDIKNLRRPKKPNGKAEISS